MKNEKLGYLLLILLGIIVVIAFFLSDPIIQDEAYHNFSDSETILGTPNFWNVWSNLPFICIGIFGLLSLKKIDRFNAQFITFFIGVFLLSFGSAYYHYDPTSSTLVWDRLPMTIAFTALISISISEFIDQKKGRLLLVPLLIIGILSIIYWVKTGDLRLYGLVQFYPMLAIPIMILFFRYEDAPTRGYWLLLVWYIIAKLLETYDVEVHQTLKFMSGHPLKHLAAAVGLLLFTNAYIRHPLSPGK